MYEPAEDNAFAAQLNRDPLLATMAASTLLILVFDMSASFVALYAKHMTLVGPAMMATAVYAIAGTVFGFVRSLRAKHTV